MGPRWDRSPGLAPLTAAAVAGPWGGADLAPPSDTPLSIRPTRAANGSRASSRPRARPRWRERRPSGRCTWGAGIG
jgi:hypothetical protein